MAAEESSMADREKRVNRSTTLPASLIERARNAVFWVRMVPGEPQTYSELTERGLQREVVRLERRYNEGRPFEAGQLRPGPPPGVMKRVAQMRLQKGGSDDGGEE